MTINKRSHPLLFKAVNTPNEFSDQCPKILCLVPLECREPFHGGSFFEHEGQPYCETHYHGKRGSLCAGCHKPIMHHSHVQEVPSGTLCMCILSTTIK
ncbi:Paxillin [Papilio machaon]|uniref:Paxillin n=1 Tax=Papilio machaon TaxID=76193 RepID=A0A194QWI9_PAPMA|nr:Paxillin [Papilio machaon]